MERHTELFAKLRNAYPFIYEVSGEYFLIGMSQSRKCTDDEIALYKNYQENYSKVMGIIKNDFDNRKYEITLADSEKLVDTINKIINLDFHSSENLDSFLMKCSESEINAILDQCSNMEKSLCIKNRADVQKNIVKQLF